MSKPQILTPIAALAAVLVAFFIVAFPADAQAPPTPSPTTNHGLPQEGLLATHSCYDFKPEKMTLGQVNRCAVKVSNRPGDGAREDVWYSIGGQDYTTTITKVQYKAANMPAVTLPITTTSVDLPEGSYLYVTFTWTKTDASQGAIRNRYACGESPAGQEGCSQGNIS